ncbi:phosphopantothenoylcysteine decarboxylase/phosphopantothenate--cysteine ligase [Leptospira meyeri]|uniref:Phosphopantothenoylcysteine decarboxylase/phosphopantothenate--cysteine ligase n=1 Tax=Leptospira meyeri TaxID=29508 RepID=A0A4R8MWH8_LEPME|nr:phosphopantothenoylcysteine decarboxylase [Leptospira meyeri]TDY72528.1 phosphopantothenoylcysteine decarboxylase/phosphopantothenate--cysteine ligase [Leptospira meyeri]
MNLKFKRVIVTSGPTREWIDPVRYISNASSGKMGFEIATSFLKYPVEVVYIHGNTLERYSHVTGAIRNIEVETTIQLRDAVLSEISNDSLLVMAAAPADFRPIMTAEHKIKKEKTSEGTKGLLLELEENPDVLQQVTEYVAEHKILNSLRVGFAAETRELERHAKDKLIRKGLTFIVGNYVGSGKGFGEVDSTIRIFGVSGLEKEIGPLPKEKIAEELVSFLVSV